MEKKIHTIKCEFELKFVFLISLCFLGGRNGIINIKNMA